VVNKNSKEELIMYTPKLPDAGYPLTIGVMLFESHTLSNISIVLLSLTLISYTVFRFGRLLIKERVR
jgi:hypothetical protein